MIPDLPPTPSSWVLPDTARSDSESIQVEPLQWAQPVRFPGTSSDELSCGYASLISDYVRANQPRKDDLRRDLGRLLTEASASSPQLPVKAALRMVLRHLRPNRLGDAIDLLTSVSPTAAQTLVVSEACRMRSEISADDEDLLYVLLRSAGRIGLPSGFVAPLLSHSSKVVREATVEAMGDIADDYAVKTLRSVADTDPSAAIRRIAAEELEDLI
jgi:hypothetical protein